MTLQGMIRVFPLTCEVGAQLAKEYLLEYCWKLALKCPEMHRTLV